MTQAKRLSETFSTSQSPLAIVRALSSDSDEWIGAWQDVYARGKTSVIRLRTVSYLITQISSTAALSPWMWRQASKMHAM